VTIATYAYLAGVIDSDGFITIQKCRPNGRRKRTYYYAKVGLGQSNEIIPALLAETFGATVTHYGPRQAGNLDTWHWQAHNRVAHATLAAIIPYLLLKRRQAEVALEFLARLKVGNKITDEEMAARIALYDEMTALNAPTNRRRHLVAA
jgi:hypothetical protein